MKQKLLIVAALFFGIVAFILTYYQLQYEKQRIRGALRNVMFVKLKKDLVDGDKITVSDIAETSEPRGVLQKTDEVEWNQKDNIVGRTVSRTVKKDEILRWSYLKEEGRSGKEGLAGMIPFGMRAISISVDATSSVTGLVRPGHHVDLVGTFKFPDMRGDKALDTITLTLLQNVIVLATGTQLANSRVQQDAGQKSYGTVTLCLTPKEVEMIIFASMKGHLVMSLRNFEETSVEKDLQSVNFKYLEEHLKSYNEERERIMKQGGGRASAPRQ